MCMSSNQSPSSVVKPGEMIMTMMTSRLRHLHAVGNFCQFFCFLGEVSKTCAKPAEPRSARPCGVWAEWLGYYAVTVALRTFLGVRVPFFWATATCTRLRLVDPSSCPGITSSLRAPRKRRCILIAEKFKITMSARLVSITQLFPGIRVS